MLGDFRLTTAEVCAQVFLKKLNEIHTSTRRGAPGRVAWGREGRGIVVHVTIKQIVAAALKLPPKKRAALAGRLIRSRENEPQELSPEEWEKAWGEEADRRIRQLREGKVQEIPGEEVMRELRDLLA